jgi:hypothetical protein
VDLARLRCPPVADRQPRGFGRVGRLRFAAPRPLRRWEGTRKTFTYGPPPPQEPFGHHRRHLVDLPHGGFPSHSRA